MQTIDLKEYMPVLIEIINTGKDVNLPVSGSSMSPFLVSARDTIIISKINKPLKKGDMVFYKRANGQYIMHRIYRITKDGLFYMIGDNESVIEGPITKENIFAIINQVIRKNHLIDSKNIIWRFFSIIWIRIIPLRSLIIRLYSSIKYNK